MDHIEPAAGSGHSAVRLRIAEPEEYSGYAGWVDAGWKIKLMEYYDIVNQSKR